MREGTVVAVPMGRGRGIAESIKGNRGMGHFDGGMTQALLRRQGNADVRRAKTDADSAVRRRMYAESGAREIP